MLSEQDESATSTIRERVKQKRGRKTDNAPKEPEEPEEEIKILDPETLEIDEDEYSDDYDSEEDDSSYEDDNYEDSSDDFDDLSDLSDDSLDALDDETDFYGDDEDIPRRKAKKRKLKKIGAKKITRKKLDALMEGPCRVFWGVFSPEMKKLFDFPFDQEAEARQKAAELTEAKGAEHFVQRLKVPIKTTKKK